MLAKEFTSRARNFCTKLWNISRFTLMSLGENPPVLHPLDELPRENLELADRWVLSRHAATAAAVNDAVDRYALGEASWLLYHFVWDVFCDWYLEFIKPVLNGGNEDEKRETRDTCAWVLDRILQLLHPFMPFITEELWARMAEHAEPRRSMLMLSPWPDLSGLPALADDSGLCVDALHGRPGIFSARWAEDEAV
jgi:valyl-tRNA synthetase